MRRRDGLRARVEAAVCSVLRRPPECAPRPDEVAVVDAVMEALAFTGDIPGRVDAHVYQNRPLPPWPDLRPLREGSGLSQHQVADIVGVTDAAISKWENGICSPQRGTVERARYLNLLDHLRERQAVASDAA